MSSPRPPDLTPAAPERVPESERVDRPVVVVPGRTVLALLALALLAGGIVLWAATAVVDRSVVVPGLAVVGGSVIGLESPVPGRLATARPAAGTVVRSGQTVAVVESVTAGVLPLTAPVDAVVLDAPLDVGDPVEAGERVLVLERTNGATVVRAFVAPDDAARIGPGTRAVVSFPDRGPVDALVDAVGSLPVETEQAAQSLGGPALGAIVAPRDGLTPVRLRPAPGAAFPTPRAGTVADRLTEVRLIVESRHPLEYVIQG
ncbi:HlyD family efflux transporter periplasmic adaptor subunit [Actinomycetospora cinnamomea]|uniref:HlyD family secretion protein n=1 Tax=Actinomycetospora cinnamomea TaxID=663609 RepID=A0A2U1FQW5_9PSEU|nr:HlyD family efflux transporter periplasmic adaptor subunit [Actinomycetospora cinnamomea]PVZ14567.1 HlyD family secretion protein [Actinomycetospora cinnamomea]